MKPTTDGRWAHLACAIWIPGLFHCNLLYLILYFLHNALTKHLCSRNMSI